MQKSKTSKKSMVWGFLGVLVVSTACSPVPRRVLTPAEKEADLKFIYSFFDQYYAPIEYKEKRLGFSYADVKDSILRQAAATQDNESFYNVAYSFGATFQDAHTSLSLTDSNLPGRTQVAVLGFTGVRKGDALVVTELLPTFKGSGTFYPIKVGDQITQLDGRSLKEIVDQEFVKVRSLGFDEANYTYHFPRIFNRTTTTGGVPAADLARVTFKRGDKEFQFDLPWVKKDLTDFTADQAEAIRKQAGNKSQLEQSTQNPEHNVFALAELLLNGKLDLNEVIVKRFVPSSSSFRTWDTFTFFDPMPMWDSSLFSNPSAARAMGFKLPKEFIAFNSPLDELKKARAVPNNALLIPESKTFPTYLTTETPKDKDGKVAGQARLVATMYLNTFSPSATEENVIAEVAATIASMQANGVSDLVIDMINNGGGSVTLGLKLAQLFSATKLTYPEIELSLNENWLNSFEQDSYNAPTDADREMARRAYVALNEQRLKGLKMSTRQSVEFLMPFQIQPNRNLSKPLNIVVIVNEMCASMCDVFSALLQDNGLARVVGTRSMGAGGNVVQVQAQSPNAKFSFTQTESLILRKDGSYLENAGVTPDVAYSVNESAGEKYKSARDKAVQVLFQ